MDRTLRAALWLQAVALAMPIAITADWSRPTPCPGQVCINAGPLFFVVSVLLFGLPLLLVLFFVIRPRALDGGDVLWLLGFDLFVVAGAAAVIVITGWLVSFLVMTAVALTALASAVLAVALWRRTIGATGRPMGPR